ncbi:unnamed protein product [Bemisia tabaci]|uniref:Uncharacterized protein n=1 Tax=Bemisia tabaci TaxID=7038 RepID=A0A9P0A1K4_BEMTA|nr:unnamed protein product [Bemisia tabaci]
MRLSLGLSVCGLLKGKPSPLWPRSRGRYISAWHLDLQVRNRRDPKPENSRSKAREFCDKESGPNTVTANSGKNLKPQRSLLARRCTQADAKRSFSFARRKQRGDAEPLRSAAVPNMRARDFLLLSILNSRIPEVTLTGMKTDLKVDLQNTGDNIYKATYCPTVPGAYLLNVMWSDRQVKGCPLKVTVSAVCDAAKVLCSGEGLGIGTVGKDIRSFIDTRRAGPGVKTGKTIGGRGAGRSEADPRAALPARDARGGAVRCYRRNNRLSLFNLNDAQYSPFYVRNRRFRALPPEPYHCAAPLVPFPPSHSPLPRRPYLGSSIAPTTTLTRLRPSLPDRARTPSSYAASSSAMSPLFLIDPFSKSSKTFKKSIFTKHDNANNTNNTKREEKQMIIHAKVRRRVGMPKRR